MVLFIKGPVYKIFNVNSKSTQPMSVIYLHPLAAHVVNGTEMTETEKLILDKIHHPLSEWAYSCYDATIFLYKGFNVKVTEEYSLFLLKTLLRFSILKPFVTLNHFFCQSSFVWNPFHPEGVMFESIYLNSSIDYPGWEKYSKDVSTKNLFPGFKTFIEKFTYHWLLIDVKKVTWRPALYFFSFIISVILFSLKSKQKNDLLIIAPILFQTLGIALTSQYQGVRYQYPVYLVSMFFSPQIIFWLIANLKKNPYKSEK
jgi:hypothetical protein